MATKKVYYVVEGQQEEAAEIDSLAYSGSDEQLAYDAEASEPRCSACGELVAWHEQACSAASAAPADNEPLISLVLPAAHTYAYDLGHVVQPRCQMQARTIIWRGQLKERHPQTGFVYRVNVYRLNDNFWDCYHEEELQLAA